MSTAIEDRVSALPDEVRQRVEWKMRAIEALVSERFDKETTVALLEASLGQAHDEGLGDAIAVVDRLVAETSGDRQFVLKIVKRSLDALRAANKAKRKVTREDLRGMDRD